MKRENKPEGSGHLPSPPCSYTRTFPGAVAIVALGAIGVVAITSIVSCGLSSHRRGPPVPAVCFVIGFMVLL